MNYITSKDFIFQIYNVYLFNFFINFKYIINYCILLETLQQIILKNNREHGKFDVNNSAVAFFLIYILVFIILTM